MKKIIFLFGFFACFIFASVVSADTLGKNLLDKSVGNVGLEANLENSLANVISTALTMVGTVFLVLTVAAGIMWMTAAGNEEKIKKAQKIIIGAAIGLILSLTAYSITYFITKRAGGAAGGGNTTTEEPAT